MSNLRKKIHGVDKECFYAPEFSLIGSPRIPLICHRYGIQNLDNFFHSTLFNLIICIGHSFISSIEVIDNFTEIKSRISLFIVVHEEYS